MSAIVVGGTRALATHRSGEDIGFFESDVDPIQGVAAITQYRQKPIGGFLPSRGRAELDLANEMLKVDPPQTRVPGILKTLKTIASNLERKDQAQRGVILLGIVAWTIVPLFFIDTYRPWRVLAICTVSVATLLLWAAVTAISGSLDHLRWGRRTNVLLARLAEPRATLDDLARLLHELSSRVQLPRYVRPKE